MTRRTAADRRDELEAEIWQAVTGAASGDHGTGPCPPCQRSVNAVLVAAAKYAAAKVDEELDRIEGRRRLAAASAEYGKKP